MQKKKNLDSPFDEQRYNRLLEGLEISILQLREVEKDNQLFRIESEYFKKEYLLFNKEIDKLDFLYLDKKLTKISGGNAFSSESFGSNGIRVAKITDISQQSDFFDWERISIDEFEKFEQRLLSENDILLGGTHHNPWDLGKVILIKNIKEKATFNQRVFQLRITNYDICPEFLFISLKSKYVRFQIEKLGRGNNQLNLNLTELNAIKIPVLSTRFQEEIKNIVNNHFDILEQSKTLYRQAEDLLLFYLGVRGTVEFEEDQPKTPEQLMSELEDTGVDKRTAFEWAYSEIKALEKTDPNYLDTLPDEGKFIKIKELFRNVDSKWSEYVERKVRYNEMKIALYQQSIKNLENEKKQYEACQQNHSVKTFSESFLQSGRLDAEYYQSKYDLMKEIVFENAEYVKYISEIETFNARGLQPIYVENGDLDVINSKHILETTLDYENFEKTDSSFWESQARGQVFKNDILTYTTGANIGRTQVYLSDKPALASNHVNILRIEEENPVYVAFVINSKIGRLQTEKLSAGSAQQELYPKDLSQFYIPFIKAEHQKEVENLLVQSETLKSQSKHLLETAKRGVEIAIERDEAAALAWMEGMILG